MDKERRMSIGEYHQCQGILLPPFVMDEIPKGDIVWLVDFLVERVLDLSPILGQYSHTGTEGYHPKGMMKLFLLGYIDGVRASRDLANLCWTDLRYRYVMASEKPHFTTIAEFRRRIKDFVVDAFVQMLSPLVFQGWITLKNISVDGSFILANASSKNVVTDENYEKVMKKLSESIKNYMAKSLKIDAEEIKSNPELPLLTEIMRKVRKFQKKQDKVESSKAALDKSGEEYRSITDPDARFMGKRDMPKELRYNAQISVDSDSQFIVAYEVVQDRSDHDQLVPQVEKVIENVGMMPESVNADTGYHSGANIEALEKKGIDCYIPDRRTSAELAGRVTPKGDYHKDNFDYHEEEDYYTCPCGKVLPLVKATTQNGKNTYIYGNPEACANCRSKKKCLRKDNKRGYRTVEREPGYEKIRLKMREKILSPEGRETYGLRRTTVEPPFGDIKENMGLRRFNMRGIDGAECEMGLCCNGRNIKRMHRKLLDFADSYDCSLQKAMELFLEYRLSDLLEEKKRTDILQSASLPYYQKVFATIILANILVISQKLSRRQILRLKRSA